MSLTDLLKEAQQRKNEIEAADEQEKLTEKAELGAKLAIEQAEFEALLKKDAGNIFDRLDESPTIEAKLKNRTVLRAKVFHRDLSVCISEAHKTWSVADSISRAYWNRRGGQFSDKKTYIEFGKLSDYLLIRFLEIAEEQDLLLARIEMENRKSIAEAKLKDKTRDIDNCLRLFAEALHALTKEHDKKLRSRVEAQVEGLWAWPKTIVLDLYKVSWCTGAYRGEGYEETEFDYDSGWSLTDVDICEPEWLVLLPERNKVARTLKTSGVVTVERFQFTEETLPDCLCDHPQKIEIDVVDIEFTVEYSQHRFRLLPELIPPLPEGCAVVTRKQVEQVSITRLPTLEIKQAIDKISVAPSTDYDNSVPL